MTRVGLCEDDEALRSVIGRALRGEGFDVRVAESGAARRSRAGSPAPAAATSSRCAGRSAGGSSCDCR
jgi:DNA-binding response OmpR family regulator